MSWPNLLIFLFLFSYIWGGFWTGLIQSIGGVVGLFLGAIVATRTYDGFGNVLSPLFNNNGIIADIVAFILIFMIVTRLVGLVFYLINKMFNFIAIVPGLKMLNRFGGAFFGFLEGALFVGITLQFISRLPISIGFAESLASASLAKYCMQVAGWIVPLFPEALKQAENAVDKVIK